MHLVFYQDYAGFVIKILFIFQNMKEILITKENSNQRADKFIRKFLNDAPLSFIYKTFRKKDVKVNGKWIKENYILKENDVLRIYINDEQIAEFNKPLDVSKVNLKINLDIVYEDKNILIVNKPKGLLAHGDSSEKRITLSNMVLSYLYNKGEFKNDGESYRPSPVHRLDRNTSGLVIFAKNLYSSQIMLDLLSKHTEIIKNYLLLTFNKPEENEGVIDAPLFKDSTSGFVKVGKIESGAKEAKTLYKLLDSNDEYSLIKATLITGRTHQLRVHFASINCPIVGDEKYGDFKKNKIFEKEYDYRTQFLIAHSLTFKEVPGELSYLSNKTFKARISNKELSILNKITLKIKDF